MFDHSGLPVIPFPTPCAWPGVPFGGRARRRRRAPAIGTYFAPAYFDPIYYGGEYVGRSIVTATLDATPGDTEVLLEWAAERGTEPYTADLYRSTTPGFDPPAEGTLIADDESTGTYTDTGLSNGTEYHYRALVTDAEGRTARSPEVAATPVNPFDPLDLSGRVGVWDSLYGLTQDAAGATPATTAGQSVGGWMDRSDTHRLTATVGTNEPLLQMVSSTPVVQFYGGSDSTNRDRLAKNLSSSTPSNLTIHLLFKSGDNGSQFWCGLTSDGNNYVASRYSITNTITFSQSHSTNYAAFTPATADIDAWHHLTIVRDGSNAHAYLNGEYLETRSVAATTTLAQVCLGSVPAIFGAIGQMLHASVYTASQTASQIRQYNAYLRDRFAAVLTDPTRLVVFGGNQLYRAEQTSSSSQDTVLPRAAWLLTAVTRPRFVTFASTDATIASWQTNQLPGAVELLKRATSKRVLLLGGIEAQTLLTESAADTYTALKNLCAAAKAAVSGLKVIVQTPLPRRGDDDTKRASLISSIKTGDGLGVAYDVVADLAGNSTIGDDGDENNTTYYNADKIRLTATGSGVADDILAAAIDAALAL